MTRRELLAGFTGALAPAWGAVRPDRLRQRIEKLSTFGRIAGGTFSNGVSRVGFSDADVAGREYVLGLMKHAGLQPRIDPAGNIWGRRNGRQDDLPPVLFGSHIDSVPNGGNFDGDLGSLGAIEVIEVLNETGARTRHPLEVVVWTNEEGVAYNNGLCGSRAAAGKLVPGELDHVWNGVRKADAFRKIGGDPDRIAEARIRRDLKCYLELHIEQGGTLDREGVAIGVVEGIVAIDRFAVEIAGFGNHAGTTRMADRQDALLAASRLVVAVNDIARTMPGRQVGTVGHLDVHPNAPNVVPGRVRMTVEFRDLSQATLRTMLERLRKAASEIGDVTRTTVTLNPASSHEAALADPALQDLVESSAKKLGFNSRRLPSGAGHDAQMAARLCPMGMIFVPSVGGISHSPKEFTSWEDCARGVQVLLESVQRAGA
ncbi:MAG: M20 family metallo-hydrolase [Bryobacteraceae bacterium]|nr:M20 family metallo-hydrolase [Bryobacteraceae bacterium]